MINTHHPINTARLLKQRTTIQRDQRPEVVIHRNRPGFIERQDGSWIHLPIHSTVQSRRSAHGHKSSKPKARRRLWHWLASMLNASQAKNKEQ